MTKVKVGQKYYYLDFSSLWQGRYENNLKTTTFLYLKRCDYIIQVKYQTWSGLCLYRLLPNYKCMD